MLTQDAHNIFHIVFVHPDYEVSTVYFAKTTRYTFDNIT